MFSDIFRIVCTYKNIVPAPLFPPLYLNLLQEIVKNSYRLTFCFGFWAPTLPGVITPLGDLRSKNPSLRIPFIVKSSVRPSMSAPPPRHASSRGSYRGQVVRHIRQDEMSTRTKDEFLLVESNRAQPQPSRSVLI